MNSRFHGTSHMRTNVDRWLVVPPATTPNPLMETRDLILLAIRPFFGTQEAWNTWVDAGPDDLESFIDYALDEHKRICNELFEDSTQ